MTAAAVAAAELVAEEVKIGLFRCLHHPTCSQLVLAPERQLCGPCSSSAPPEEARWRCTEAGCLRVVFGPGPHPCPECRVRADHIQKLRPCANPTALAPACKGLVYGGGWCLGCRDALERARRAQLHLVGEAAR